jgi:hypothetical protein
MEIPVFRHTISFFRELITEDIEKIAHFIKYDPTIAYLILREVNKPCTDKEITSFIQITNYLGTSKIEQIILERDSFLDDEDLQIWIYSILSAEIASAISNNFTNIAQDEAFFAGLLPSLGMLFMLNEFPKYRSIIHFLIKLPIEDRVYIEEKIFGTSHIETLQRNILCPALFRNTVNILNKIFLKDGQKDIKSPVQLKGSTLQQSYDLALLSDLATYGTQTLMFPSVVDNRELYLELAKRYFLIKESVAIEVLQNAMDNFIDIATQFKVVDEIRFSTETFYELKKFKFETKNSMFEKALKQLFEENAKEKNIFIYGEVAVGKRLLAAALHTSDTNPRKDKPFIMIFCDVDSSTLEEEFFGIKDGYLGKKGKKGVLKRAEGGTLVLKEFDSMPKEFQEKLQKAIQDKKFYSIGEVTPAELKDVRFILIGKHDIRIKIAKEELSSSLLKLLNPFFFKIPPLRERREDVFYIAGEIIKKYNLNIIEDKLKEPAIIQKLETDPFPNNLRDLKRFLFLLYIQKLLNS